MPNQICHKSPKFCGSLSFIFLFSSYDDEDDNVNDDDYDGDDDKDDNEDDDNDDDDEDNHQIAAASGRSHLNSGSVSIAESPLMPSSSSLSSLSLLKYRVFF